MYPKRNFCLANYSRSVLKSNGLHRPKIRLKKFSFSLKIVPAYISKKLPSQCWPKPLFIAFFNFSHKWPTFAFTPKTEYTLGSLRKIAHKGLHTETQGFTLVIAWRFISHLTFGQAKAGGSGCTPTACVRFLRRRGPAGLRNPVCNLAMLLFCALCAGHSACTRLGWYHYSRCVSHAVETPGARLPKRLICRFSRPGSHH